MRLPAIHCALFACGEYATTMTMSVLYCTTHRMVYAHITTVALYEIGRPNPLALCIGRVESDFDLLFRVGLDFGNASHDAVLIIVFVYFGEMRVPEPGHDFVVELVVVQGKRCVAHAVGGKGELVGRVDLLWGRHGE